MTHPLVPKIIELAQPVASGLGLEVVDAVFHTNHAPPILRIDIRNLLQEDTGLEDCERMSIALEECLDKSEIIPDAYVLEVSSPGVSDLLTQDRDFVVFRGFAVEVQLLEPFKAKSTWQGNLVERTDDCVVLNQKGRAVSIPRSLVKVVNLSSDAGDGG
jgi:ribosome maturation factor RimP